MADRALEWYIATLETAQDGVVGVNAREPLDYETVEELQRAGVLLANVSSRSTFAELQARATELMSELARVEALVDGGGVGIGTDFAHALERKLDALLSALRAFDDRTSHQLSGAYGADSEQLKSFKETLSAAFDTEFAYRFCWKLRNYSQHCGNPISNLNATSAEEPDGTVTTELIVTFDSVQLLREYDGWGATVRADLERIGGGFQLEPVIDALMGACFSVFLRLLLIREPEITEAIRMVQDMADLASSTTGRPVVVGIPPDIDSASPRMSMKVMDLPVAAVANAQALLHQARAAA